MIGKQIGNYKIVELIGKGGMAVVYRGQHLTLSRRIVAIKMLSTELERDPSFSERFFREAEVMDRLKHPNIVTLYDFIEQDNHHFIVMEYVSGITLNQIIKETNGPLPLSQIRDIFKQVLDAIGYAHRLGIVHRDLKPSNIMINKEGQVKITDFGIARLLAENFEATLTTTGMGIGSPYYMSPEQVLASKEHPITGASDIYSLGITLYQMVTGHVPFSKKDSLFTILQAHISATPPPPRQFCPDIPESLEEIILKAIEKKPEHRWATCEDFWQALDKAITEAEEGKTQPCVPPSTVQKGEAVPPPPEIPPPEVPPIPPEATDTVSPEISAEKLPEVEPPRKGSLLKVILSLLIIAGIAGAGGYFYVQHKKVVPPHSTTVVKEEKTKENAVVREKLDKARSLAGQGAFDEAIRILDQVIKDYPDNKLALKLRDEAVRKKQAKADEELKKEIVARLNRARSLLNRGSLEEAEKLASEILAIDPGNKEALKIIDTVNHEEEKFVKNTIAKGYSFLKTGKFDEAIRVADAVLEKYPENPKALKLKSDALLEKDRAERGIQNEVAIKLVKAEAYLDAQNYTKAKLLAEKILKLDPENEKAKAIFDKAKAGEKRKFVDEKLGKGYTYLEAKAYSLALREAREILKVYPDEPRALKLKEEASALLEKKRREELARRRARIARYMNEGKRFFSMGKYEQSMLAFREVLRIDPNNKQAKIWLARAKKELEAVRKAWATGGGAYKIEKQNPKEE